MKHRRWILGISVLCIMGGVLLIGSTLLSNIYNYNQNQKEIALYKETYFEEQPKENIEENTTFFEDEDILCILSIPKIDSEELVREGSSKEVLSKGLGHMENTALPGTIGNFVVAGHRNYTFGRFFNRLDEVEIGDEIYVETKDTIYTYKVSNIQIVTPDTVSILESKNQEIITLFTCTPLYIATHRLVITGDLIQTEER